jgi:hypothetical protein
MMTFDVRNRGSASSIWTCTILLPGGLTNDLKYLGTSSGPMGENGTYPGVDPWAVAEAYIDNVVLSVPGETPSAFLDDFEDGVIDTNLWITEGGKGGGWSWGGGDWQYSFNEYRADDGYLEARVWGPPSGITYFGEAAVRTTYNFNDGKEWLINFTWETTIAAGYTPHFSCAGVQITDDGLPQSDNCYWIWNANPAGTATLWYTVAGHPHEPKVPFSKRTWSITISPDGVARLYQSANASGAPYSEVALDKSRQWYVRFIELDATSAGFDGGDNTLRLFQFAAGAGIEGVPPIPDAGDDIVADANEEVTLDGSKSSDPDGQIIKYTWKRLPDGVIIYSGKEPTCQTRALGRVEEVIELTVTDNSLSTASDTLKIISRTTQEFKDQLAAMQSQIEQLQQQHQETRDLVDRICSYPPIKWWLRRAIRLGDLNNDGKVNMSDLALLTKDWLH